MTRTIVIECQDCGGTGLYKGKAEKDECAVVCHNCKGTGKTEFTYNEFEGRKEMEGVTRVFENSFGYAHSSRDRKFPWYFEYPDKDYVTVVGRDLHFSKFGCSYEDWKKGVKPLPMEELYCPYVYENHGMEKVESGNPVKEPCEFCKVGCGGNKMISKCSFYYSKKRCWQEWHQKNK